jgi:hypothetical protein
VETPRSSFFKIVPVASEALVAGELVAPNEPMPIPHPENKVATTKADEEKTFERGDGLPPQSPLRKFRNLNIGSMKIEGGAVLKKLSFPAIAYIS